MCFLILCKESFSSPSRLKCLLFVAIQPRHFFPAAHREHGCASPNHREYASPLRGGLNKSKQRFMIAQGWLIGSRKWHVSTYHYRCHGRKNVLIPRSLAPRWCVVFPLNEQVTETSRNIALIIHLIPPNMLSHFSPPGGVRRGARKDLRDGLPAEREREKLMTLSDVYNLLNQYWCSNH